MGVSANFYTKKLITCEEVVDILKSSLDIITGVSVHTIEGETEKRTWYQFSFSIMNGSEPEARTISFFPNCRDLQNWGKEDFIKVEDYALLTLSKWGKSTEILTKIGEHIGGWLDEDDCDSLPDVYIKSKSEVRIESIKKVLS